MPRAADSSPGFVNESDLRALLELAATSDLLELEVEQDDFRVRIRREPGEARAVAQVTVSRDGADASGGIEEPPPVLVRSPLVGVFRAQVKVGDAVAAGQVVGVVDALRMSHPVEADCPGVVEAILVEDDHAVEYGQALIHLRDRAPA